MKVIKVVAKFLRSKQAALVDAVFGSLLKIANEIVGPIMASPLAFHESDVGRWDGHRWISHKTFSGTEQALTFVAIEAALSHDVPVRLLIFDELGRLDHQRRADLINLLIAARKQGLHRPVYSDWNRGFDAGSITSFDTDDSTVIAFIREFLPAIVGCGIGTLVGVVIGFILRGPLHSYCFKLGKLGVSQPLT